MCVRNAEDCCTPTYLNRLSHIVQSELDEYIPTEFRDGIDSTLSKVDKLIGCESYNNLHLAHSLKCYFVWFQQVLGPSGLVEVVTDNNYLASNFEDVVHDLVTDSLLWPTLLSKGT